MHKIDVRDYRIDLTGVHDATRGLQDAFYDAIRLGMGVYLPAGQYRLTSTLWWPDQMPRIEGTGYMTQLRPEASTFDALHVGAGDGAGVVVAGAGYVRGLHIRGPEGNYSPLGRAVGLHVNGANWVDVRDISVAFMPVGFRLSGTAYGCNLTNLSTFAHECAFGIVLPRDGNVADGAPWGGAGNDIPMTNCRFLGGQVGMWLDGQNGAYHMVACIVSGGMDPNALVHDNRGSLMMGAGFDEFAAFGFDWNAGIVPVGSCYLSAQGLQIERANKGWGYRLHGYGQHPNGFGLDIRGNSSVFAGAEALGLIKLTGGYNDRITLDHFGAAPRDGVFASPLPVVVENVQGASKPKYAERGWMGGATFGGQFIEFDDRGPLSWSGLV